MPRQTEGWTEGWTELILKTLLATTGGSKSADHIKHSNISSPTSICLL